MTFPTILFRSISFHLYVEESRKLRPFGYPETVPTVDQIRCLMPSLYQFSE